MTLNGRRQYKRVLGAAAFFWVLAAVSGTAGAAPKAELWERWLRHDPASARRVDHSRWGAFLARYLIKGRDGVNRVAYGAVRPEDRRLLEDYLADLQATEVSRLNRNEQRAYWINLYNALTVKVILDHHPVSSILKINTSPGWFSRGPWGEKVATVEGERISLDDIEHRILRPIWKDPRVHYAVNCASIGCPNLAPVPYTAATADTMLDRGARAYVNHPRGVDLSGGRLKVSSIYVWYKEDFGGTDRGVIEHLRRYAAPGLAERLAGVERIDEDDYDWRLNEGKTPADAYAPAGS